MDTSTKPTAVTVSRIALTVNGQPRQLELDPRTSLLDALREHLHLTGTKKGCDHGQRSTCTVVVDGVNSCLALAIAQQGKKITTIEGLATGDVLHPIQSAGATAAIGNAVFHTTGRRNRTALSLFGAPIRYARWRFHVSICFANRIWRACDGRIYSYWRGAMLRRRPGTVRLSPG